MMRLATLFSRSQASSPALGNNSYPTALSAALGEEQVYFPGLAEWYPALAKIARGGAGNTVKLKFQGTNDPADPLLIGAGNAQISLYAVAPGLSIRLEQATGVSVATSNASSGGQRLITLASDADRRPADTAASLHTFIATNLGADFVSAVGAGGGAGIMGATSIGALAVPELPRWLDIESTREDTGTTAAEHTVDAGLAGALQIAFQVRTGGWRAVRCLASGTAAPGVGDLALITMSLPG